MNRNTQIAAAVAAILGSAGTQMASAAATNPPTISQAASATVQLYVAGSSAAKNAVVAALQGGMCNGSSNALTISSTSNKNFLAVSCAPASGTAGADGNTYFTVYYRTEGGSVVGALPIANNDQIKQLDLTGVSGCAANTCTPTVSGTSSANGIDDSFGGPVVNKDVQLGIMDVEPGALTGNNYPTPYLTSAWGPVNQGGLVALNGSATQLFGEVYGIFVNTGTSAVFTENGSAVSASNPLQLSQQTLAQLLTKGITNWSKVVDVYGKPVTTTSLAVNIVNREKGSGSRAATDLLIAGDVCQSGGKTLAESKSTNVDYFATGDVLAAANSVAGSITYATIENIGANANLTIVALNGINPSSNNGNLAAATGQYPFWVEATVLQNSNVSYTSAQTALITFLTSSMQAIASAPHLADVVAIPGLQGNTSSVNTAGTANTTTVSGLGTATIYVNPFTRSGVTCNLPVSTL